MTTQAIGSEFASYLNSIFNRPSVNGLYEVKAVLSQGGKSAEASTTFEVTGGQRPRHRDATVLDKSLPVILLGH